MASRTFRACALCLNSSGPGSGFSTDVVCISQVTEEEACTQQDPWRGLTSDCPQMPGLFKSEASILGRCFGKAHPLGQPQFPYLAHPRFAVPAAEAVHVGVAHEELQKDNVQRRRWALQDSRP